MRARFVPAALPALDDGPQAVPRARNRFAHRRCGPRHPHRGLPRHRRQLPPGGPAAGGSPSRSSLPGGWSASSLRPSSTRGARSGSACGIRGSRSCGRRWAILAGPALAAATRKQGVHVEYLPVPTARSTQLARDVASGKECVPALLVLGSVLEFVGSRTPRRPDEALLVAVPSTLGPCRTGQYHVFYDRLFDELGLDKVALLRVGGRVVVRGTRARVHARPVARHPALGLLHRRPDRNPSVRARCGRGAGRVRARMAGRGRRVRARGKGTGGRARAGAGACSAAIPRQPDAG